RVLLEPFFIGRGFAAADCRFALDTARLIDDSFEKAPDGARVERSGIHLFGMREHLLLALGDVDRELEDGFDLADLARVFGALVEELDDDLVDAVDGVAESRQFYFRIDPVHKQKTPSGCRWHLA